MKKPTPKAANQPKEANPPNRAQLDDLASHLAGVLNNPSCPEHLRNAVIDSLCDHQTRVDTWNFDFLFGLLISTPKQEQEGGGQ